MKRLTEPAAFFAGLGGGVTVVMHSGCAEPPALSRHLAAQASAMKGARLLTLMPMGDPSWASEAATAQLEVATFFPGRGLRAAVDEGRARILRYPLSAIPGLFDRGEIRADVLLLQVSEPDDEGRVSLGVSVDYMHAVLAQSPLVVAEINPRMPRTCGASALHVSQIALCIDAAEPPQTLPPAAGDDVDRRIAQHVAGLLDDRAVLQIGIGSVPDQVLSELGHLKHLGLHSGIVTDAVRPLIESGVIDNSAKARFTGVSVTTMAAGTQGFYDFLHRNTAIEFHSCALTHDRAFLATIDGLCAINSALQVDLAGRVNAERANGRQISLPGGLPDFAAGASRARGGKSIIALRSSFAKGAQSNIVARLGDAAPVTVGPDEVDFVITEYGVAALRATTLAERAKALIAVAHPQHRERLEREFAAAAQAEAAR